MSLQGSIDRVLLSVPPDLPLLAVVNQMSLGDLENVAAPPEASSSLVCSRTKRSSYALVLREGRLVGILTERDIVKLTAQRIDLGQVLVGDVMTQRLITLRESDLAHPFSILGLFQKHRIRHLPVVGEQGQVLGVVTPYSIRRILQSTDLFRLRRVEEVMSRRVVQALPQTGVLELARLMTTHRVSCVVLAEPVGSLHPPEFSPVGIVTERDVVQFQALELNLETLTAQTVMSTPLACLGPQDDLWAAHQTMDRMRVRRLVVADENNLLRGIITQSSILAALDPVEMQKTIAALRQQIEHLQDERVRLLEARSAELEGQVQRTESRFRAIFNQAFQFIGLLGLDGTLLEANQTALDFGGLRAEEVIGRPFWDAYWWTISAETQAQLRAAIARAAQGEFVRYEVDVLGVGRVATIDFSLRPVFDDGGQVHLLIPEGRDISDRKRAEAALRQSEQRYAKLTEAAPVGIFQTDAAGHCLYVNELWCRITGLSLEQARGNGWVQGLHPADRDRVAAEWYEAAQANRLFRLEYRFQTPAGQMVWVLGQAVAETNADGQVSGYIGTVVDITERKRAELALAELNQELFREKELAQVTLQSIADAVITTDASGQIMYLNPVAEQLTGWRLAEVQGLALEAVFHIISEITREPVENPVDYVLQAGCVTGLANHTLLIDRNGKEYSIEDSAAPIHDRQGQMIGAVIVFHDVTQSRQLQYRLSWQASHDALTGLPNRRQFEQVLTDVLSSAQETPQASVLCYLDLDQFKVVNDTCGHKAGDELLRRVSRLLKGQIRAADSLARLGGDEFGILLRQCPLDNAKRITEKLRETIQAFRSNWEDKAFRIGVSIGLVALNEGSQTLADALGAADAACYAAKEGGRNRIHIYQTDDAELLRQRGERQWSVRIRRTLEEGRFQLYRQAIARATAVADAPYACYEVLLRMVDEAANLVSPDIFIPAAERYGLMPEVDRWVIQRFLAYAEQHLSLSHAENSLEVLYLLNLSGASISDSQFLTFLQGQLTQRDLPPIRIGFEITETAAIANLEQASQFIRTLKRLGCQFALDDFGSGMSSFAYLKNLPVDYLKIDGDFIKNIDEDPTAFAIVESINHIGHVMGLQTIAESVETPSLRDTLVEIGVDYLQGYSVATPIPMVGI